MELSPASRQAACNAQQPNRGHLVRRAVRAGARAARRGHLAVSCAALLRVRVGDRPRPRLRLDGAAARRASRHRRARDHARRARRRRRAARRRRRLRRRSARRRPRLRARPARHQDHGAAAHGTLSANGTQLTARALRLLHLSREQIEELAGASPRWPTIPCSVSCRARRRRCFTPAIMLIAFYFFLLEGPRLRGWLERVSPLEPRQTRDLSPSFAASRAPRSSARRSPRCSRRWPRPWAMS